MIADYEETLLEQIDAQIESATDDELFAGGYLRGHISLAAASCEEEQIDNIDELKKRVDVSLEQAKNELSPADQVIVRNLWEALQSQIDI